MAIYRSKAEASFQSSYVSAFGTLSTNEPRLVPWSDCVNQLFRAAKQMHPEKSNSDRLLRARLMTRMALNIVELRRIYSDKSNPSMLEMLRDHPTKIAAVGIPYLHGGWSAREKLKVIEGHHRLLNGKLSFLRALRGEGSIQAAEVPGADGLVVVLNKAKWLMSEGELALNLIENGVRLFSLAFTLGKVGSENVAYVGALQGYGSDDALDTYRRLTRTLHDMRPRDFLMAAFRFVATELNVQSILAVSEDARIHRTSYHAGHQGVEANYDQIWGEMSEEKLDTGFWKISPTVKYRSAEEIPARKRALYRRRYQMLDQVREQIQQLPTRY